MSVEPADISAPPADPRNWVWRSSQAAFWLLFRGWTGFRSAGAERIAPGGGLLLINHQSFLDPAVVGVPLSRPVSFLARDSLFRFRPLGAYFRGMTVIPINRDAAGPGSLKEAIRRLRSGRLVGIFPEGTRTDDGSLLPFKPGFVALMRRAGVPVYPVGIAGAFEALPRGKKLPRKRPIAIVYGTPFTADELQGDAEVVTETARQRIAVCMAEAAALLPPTR